MPSVATQTTTSNMHLSHRRVIIFAHDNVVITDPSAQSLPLFLSKDEMRVLLGKEAEITELKLKLEDLSTDSNYVLSPTLALSKDKALRWCHNDTGRTLKVGTPAKTGFVKDGMVLNECEVWMMFHLGPQISDSL